MDAAELEAIRQKVERGERLSDAELDRLRAAAQAQPGPTLRLAVAHALINNGEDTTALALLERLVRDFPRDLQCWLGLARAQISLDHKAEAERALQQALKLSPEDPEALKVLAILALQRGEFPRARQLINDVLRRDPFDDEAKLVRAELEAADLAFPPARAPEPAAPPPASEAAGAAGARDIALRPEFTRALLRVLRARGVQALVKGEVLLIRPPNSDVARVNLGSLYAAYLAGQKPLEESVSALADGLNAAALGVPDSAEALLQRVLPVLRPPSFVEVAPGAAYREGPAGLLVFYVIDDPELVRYVPQGSLAARGLELEAVDRAAFEALARRPAPLRRVSLKEGRIEPGSADARIVAVCAEDGHDAARLLTSAQRELIAEELGPGPWRVDLGRREVALVCAASDPVATMAVDALAPAADGIPGAFVLHPDGRLEPFAGACA